MERQPRRLWLKSGGLENNAPTSVLKLAAGRLVSLDPLEHVRVFEVSGLTVLME